MVIFLLCVDPFSCYRDKDKNEIDLLHDYEGAFISCGDQKDSFSDVKI